MCGERLCPDTHPCPAVCRERASKLKADATACYRKREFEQALRLYEEGQSVNPDPSDISFLLNQAAVHFETGNLEQCVAVCRQAIDSGRDHRAPFAMLAKVRFVVLVSLHAVFFVFADSRCLY
jgi:tetratricopeptide (TPR) repeat protein